MRIVVMAGKQQSAYDVRVMREKFEDLMRSGPGLRPGADDPPDVIRWINLLTALGFTMFCTMMSEPGSWGDGLVFFVFFGMTFGPVVFLISHGFTMMVGGKSSWWTSIACLVLMFVTCGYFLLARFGLNWLI